MRLRIGAALLLVLLCVPALFFGVRASSAVEAAQSKAHDDKVSRERVAYRKATADADTYVKRRAGKTAKVRGIVQVTHVGAKDREYDYALEVDGTSIALDLDGARIDGKRVNPGADRLALQPGQVVVANGTLSGGSLAVTTASLTTTTVPYGPKPITEDPTTHRGPTVRKAVVLPVMYADDTEATRFDLDDLKQNLYGAGGESVVDYFKASSSGVDSNETPPSPTAGDITFDFEVRDWKKVAVNRPSPNKVCHLVQDSANQQVLDDDAVLDLFGIDPSTAPYEHYLFVLPCRGVTAHGGGEVGGPDSWYFDVLPDVYTLAHELGHNLGLMHSARDDCKTAGIAAPTGTTGNCTERDYGGGTDVMGTGNTVYLLNAFHRLQLGFIPTTNLLDAEPAEGVNRSFWYSTGRMWETAQAVKLPRPNNAATGSAYTDYYVSARHDALPFDDFVDSHPLMTGLEIVSSSSWNTRGPQPRSIDTRPTASPASQGATNWHAHPYGQTRETLAFTLDAGRSFFDPVENYTVTNRTSGPGLRTVQIEPGAPRHPATSVGLSGRRLLVRASANVGNNVVIGQVGTDLVIADYGVVTTPGPGCTAPVANNPQIVKCPSSGFDSVVVTLDDRDDQASVSDTTTVPVTLVGGDGNDTLIGGAGNDTLIGGAGQDFVHPGVSGTDTVSFADLLATQPVTFDQTGTSQRMATSAAGDDELATDSFEKLIGSPGVDTIKWTADGGAKTVDGNLGADVIQLANASGNTVYARDGVTDTTLNCGNATGSTIVRDVADPAPLNCGSSTSPTTPVIVTGPAEGEVTKVAAQFTFKTYVTPEPTTYECKVAPDQSTFSSCGASFTLPTLPAGSKTLSVRRVGQTAVTTRSFITDGTAPTISITSQPSNPATGRYSTFAFSSNDNVTYTCSLDGAASTDCTSPTSYPDLSQTSHTLSVTARDQAGNVSSPATATWTIDRVAPDTTITSGPTGPTTSATPTFGFSTPATDGNGFECRVVPLGGTVPAWAACSGASTHTPSTLTDGQYRFEVRAKDLAGNRDPSPATRDVIVLATAGTVAIASGTLDIDAYAGRTNALRVTHASSTYTIDDEVSIRATSGTCTQVTDKRVTCPSASITAVDVDAGDLADSVRVDAPVASTLKGNTGNDSLRGVGAAKDTFAGGGGTDTVTYEGVTWAVNASINGAADDGPVSGTKDQINTDVEQLVGGDAGDTLVGGALVIGRLSGGPGNDTLTSGSAGARLDGGPGNDTLNGTSSGEDTLDYSSRTDVLSIVLGVEMTAGTETDTFGPSIEGVIAGSADDEIWDSAADEDIWGGPGNDEISAYAGGSDYVRGEAGNDRIIDGGGNDWYYGDEDDDEIWLAGNGGSDQVTGGYGYDTIDTTMISAGVNLSADGVLNDGVPGQTAQLDNVFDDFEHYKTGAGNDTIDYGDQSESGGSIDAGGGTDTITFAARAQGVKVFWGGTSYAAYANPGHLAILNRVEKIIGSPYADELSGGDGVSTDQAITIDGAAGNDTIEGGYYNDVLIGGAGIDVLTGGNGNDSLQTKEGTAGDQLTCGAGTDTASLDTTDTISVPADCETKTY